VSCCIDRRKPVPARLDRGDTLRYAWLRAPPRSARTLTNPKPQSGCLTQDAPYEGGQAKRARVLYGGHGAVRRHAPGSCRDGAWTARVRAGKAKACPRVVRRARRMRAFARPTVRSPARTQACADMKVAPRSYGLGVLRRVLAETAGGQRARAGKAKECPPFPFMLRRARRLRAFARPTVRSPARTQACANMKMAVRP